MTKVRKSTPRLRGRTLHVRGFLSRVAHTHHSRRFWFTVALVVAALTILIAHHFYGIDGGTLHHIAIAVVAERFIGVGSEEG